jgi:hypothetical protein
MVYGLYPKNIRDAKDIIQATSAKHAIAYFAKRNDMSKKILLVLYEVKLYEVKRLNCPGLKT